MLTGFGNFKLVWLDTPRLIPEQPVQRKEVDISFSKQFFVWMIDLMITTFSEPRFVNVLLLWREYNRLVVATNKLWCLPVTEGIGFRNNCQLILELFVLGFQPKPLKDSCRFLQITTEQETSSTCPSFKKAATWILPSER